MCTEIKPPRPAADGSGEETQLQLTARKLAAARQELRLCETRLFACERAILALKRENAELERLCARACALGFDPESEEAAPPLPAPDEPPAVPPEPAWLHADIELLTPPERPAPARAEPDGTDEVSARVLASLDRLLAEESLSLGEPGRGRPDL